MIVETQLFPGFGCLIYCPDKYDELQKLITELDLSTQEVKEILTQTQMETNVELAKLEEEINQELQETPSVGEVDDPSIDSE